jgi:hypothetical protein
MNNKLVHGVGIYEKGKYVSRVNGHPSEEYSKWIGMLQRCYSSKCQSKYPTYLGCEVSDNFKNFQYFAEWCNKQIGFAEGYQLDKDLLVKGNKLYSEDNCVFIPREINMFLTTAKSARGEHFIGVHYDKVKKKFKTALAFDNKMVYLGSFDSQEEAFITYKSAKEKKALELSEIFKNKVDHRVIEALINFRVSIED